MPRRSRQQRPRCGAPTARGGQCQRLAAPDTDPPRCWAHADTGPDEKASGRIVQLLSAGNYLDVAVAAAGVPRAVFDEWLKRGDPAGHRRNDEVYREFRGRVENARAEAEAR